MVEESQEKSVTPNVTNSVPIINNSVNQKSNPWKITSVVLVILLIGLAGYVFLYKSNATGNVIKSDDAGKKLVDFLNGRTGGGVTYVNSTDKGDIYEVTVSYQKQDIPVYITKDGQYFVQGAVLLTGNGTTAPTATQCTNDSDCAQGETCQSGQCAAAPKNVPKTSKPNVQAFVFAYCPYGLQFEKALFPAYDALKSNANISIVFIGNMHDPQGCTGTACFEKTETYRQICINKNYGTDKLISYLKLFVVSSDVSACNGADSCIQPLVTKMMTSLSIDTKKISDCMTNDAPAIYDSQGTLSNSLGVSGSPTFMINGVEVSVNRTPDSIKQAICNAFTTSPKACTQTLSTSAVSAGFGGSASSGASTGVGSAASCGTS